MNSLKTQITGHFILYEVFKVATGESLENLLLQGMSRIMRKRSKQN